MFRIPPRPRLLNAPGVSPEAPTHNHTCRCFRHSFLREDESVSGRTRIQFLAAKHGIVERSLNLIVMRLYFLQSNDDDYDDTFMKRYIVFLPFLS